MKKFLLLGIACSSHVGSLNGQGPTLILPRNQSPEVFEMLRICKRGWVDYGAWIKYELYPDEELRVRDLLISDGFEEVKSLGDLG